jgi:hypothetical protein
VGNYATVAEVRVEGVPGSVSNAQIERRIGKWEAIIEALTRNVFRVLAPGELIFDGNDSDLLHFNIPMVACTSVKINNETTALDSAYYRAFTNKSPPRDDRHNPKLELINRSTSIFSMQPGLFLKGMDQLITATWGYVDDDPDDPGSYITPPAIADCVVRLVVMDLDPYASTGGEGLPAAGVRRERTDGHEIEYQQTEDVRVSWAMVPKDIATILAMYRAPLAIEAPSSPKYLGGGLLQSTEVFGYRSW